VRWLLQVASLLAPTQPPFLPSFLCVAAAREILRPLHACCSCKLLTYNDKLSDWNTRTNTSQNKVVECDDQQNKAQQATCNWRSYVLASQTEYDPCRTRTLKAYADVLVLNKANSEDYKTDWEAMKRLQCCMNVLRNDIQASGAELTACQEQTVSLSDFDVVEPTVAA
jgi:hypothetical protein